MFGDTAKAHVLANLVRVGIVSATDPARATVRVAFEDRDGLVSHDLPVIVPQTLRNKDYFLPDVGEQVVCLFLPGGMETGFVLGAVYSTADPVPVADQDKRHVAFEDGAVFEYDRAAHKWSVNVPGDIEVHADGNLAATCGGDASLDATGEASVTSAVRAQVTAPQVTLNGTAALTVATPSLAMSAGGGGATTAVLQGNFTLVGAVNLTGNLTVDGDIEATGTVIDAAGNTPHHTHG